MVQRSRPGMMTKLPALLFAVSHYSERCVDVVEALLENGADVSATGDPSSSLTAIHVVARWGVPEEGEEGARREALMRVLISFGAAGGRIRAEGCLCLLLSASEALFLPATVVCV